MKTVKFILSRLNIVIFSIIVLVGSVLIVDGIISNNILDIINKSPLAIIIGALLGCLSCNYYVKTCIKEETKRVKDFKEQYLGDSNDTKH